MSLLTSTLTHIPVSFCPCITPNLYFYHRHPGEREEKRHKVEYWAIVHSVDTQNGNMSPGLHPAYWTGEKLDIAIGARVVEEKE